MDQPYTNDPNTPDQYAANHRARGTNSVPQGYTELIVMAALFRS